jgi:hypothetical protein
MTLRNEKGEVVTAIMKEGEEHGERRGMDTP